MKLRVAQLTLVPSLALVAAQAFAQGAAPEPTSAVAVTVTAIRFAAAGSVFHVADGVVLQAAYAQVAPPAPGFVYER